LPRDSLDDAETGKRASSKSVDGNAGHFADMSLQRFLVAYSLAVLGEEFN